MNFIKEKNIGFICGLLYSSCKYRLEQICDGCLNVLKPFHKDYLEKSCALANWCKNK